MTPILPSSRIRHLSNFVSAVRPTAMIARLLEGEALGSLQEAALHGADLTSAYEALSAAERQPILARCGNLTEALLALAGESDGHTFYEELLSIGIQAQEQERNELAAAIFGALLHHSDGNNVPSGTLRARARERLAVLSGGNPGLAGAEYLLERFFRTCIDPVNWMSFLAGGIAFRGVRYLATARLARSPALAFLNRGFGTGMLHGFGTELLAGTAGVAAEATVFPFAARGIHYALGRGDLPWDGTTLLRELWSSLLLFGTARFGGALGSRLDRWFHFRKTSRIMDQVRRSLENNGGGAVRAVYINFPRTGQLFRQVGISSGLLMAVEAEQALGERPFPAYPEDDLTDGAALWATFNVARVLSKMCLRPGL